MKSCLEVLCSLKTNQPLKLFLQLSIWSWNLILLSSSNCFQRLVELFWKWGRFMLRNMLRNRGIILDHFTFIVFRNTPRIPLCNQDVTNNSKYMLSSHCIWYQGTCKNVATEDQVTEKSDKSTRQWMTLWRTKLGTLMHHGHCFFVTTAMSNTNLTGSPEQILQNNTLWTSYDVTDAPQMSMINAISPKKKKQLLIYHYSSP